MSKRRSAKQGEHDFNHVFERPTPKKKTPTSKIPWLSMTDEEIDKTYVSMGKADRTRMKKAAAVERQRIEVRKVLALEAEEELSDGKKIECL